jgi:hypothetical protein
MTDQAAPGGIQNRVLTALRARPNTSFTLDQLTAATGLRRQQVADALDRLIRFTYDDGVLDKRNDEGLVWCWTVAPREPTRVDRSVRWRSTDDGLLPTYEEVGRGADGTPVVRCVETGRIYLTELLYEAEGP